MAVPLLGILGAGLATQALAHGWAIPAFQRRQGEQMRGLLADLPEGANTDAKIEALATGGLLSPQQYAQYGSGDANSRRDFLETLAQQNQQYDLADRNAGRAAQRALDMLPEELGIRDAFAEQAADRERNRDTMLNLEEQTSAIESGLTATLAPLSDQQDLYREAVQIADSLYNQGEKLGWNSPWFSSAEAMAQSSRLKEIEDRLFYDHVRKTRGVDTEPSPQELERLRGGYQTFTDSAGGIWNAEARYNATRETYMGRLDRNSQEANSAQVASMQMLNRLFRDTGQPIPYPDVGFGTSSLDASPMSGGRNQLPEGATADPLR